MRKWSGYNNNELLCPISENGLVLKGSMTDLDAQSIRLEIKTCSDPGAKYVSVTDKDQERMDSQGVVLKQHHNSSISDPLAKNSSTPEDKTLDSKCHSPE